MRKEGRGTQSILAAEVGKSGSYISQILNQKKKASFDTQVVLAEAVGYTYESFLALGRRLLSGESAECEQPAAPESGIDPEVLEALRDNKFFEKAVLMMKNLTEEQLSEVQKILNEKLKMREMEKKLKELEDKTKRAG